MKNSNLEQLKTRLNEKATEKNSYSAGEMGTSHLDFEIQPCMLTDAPFKVERVIFSVTNCTF